MPSERPGGTDMLKVRDLHAGYGKADVLHGVNFDVGAGECVALVGANGAGKSTTLKCHTIVRLGITMCPEGRQVFPDMSVRENLEMGAHVRRDRGQAADIEAMMDLFPVLRSRSRQSAGTLSGGEQEMLAIARALMSKPKLCIFDEPSLGLAPKIVAEVEQTLARIKAMGVTVLLVEQNASMALRLADRAYVYEAGEIVLQGTGAELQAHPEVSKAYLGY